MKTRLSMVSSLLVLGFTSSIYAQGFLNLGFESTPVYVGSDFFTGEPDYSVPHWTVSYNGVSQSGVLSNNYVLDYTTAALIINSGATIDGNQSLFLAASSYEAPNGGVSTVSITQNALIPVSANAIQFKLGSIDAFGNGINANLPQNNFFVAVNGQIVPLQILSDTSSLFVLGGNISQWAGQMAQLSIGVSVPYNNATSAEILFSGVIDSVVISATPVPEPSTLILMMTGITVVSILLRRTYRYVQN